MGDGILMCCSIQPHQHHLYPLSKVVHFINIWISGEVLIPIGLSVIWLKVTIFNFRCYPPVHCPAILEVDGLLAEGTTEPLTSGARFY